MCGVSINDTTGVFFARFLDDLEKPLDALFDRKDHLVKFVLNVENGKWLDKDYQFHNVKEYYNFELELACASIVTKNLDL